MLRRPEFSRVLGTVRTKADLDRLLMEIDWLRESLYRLDNEFEQILERKVRSEVVEAIKPGLPEGKEAREKYLRELEEEVKALPSVSLKLAIEPSQELVEAISRWLEQNVGRVVVELTTDSSLIAGAEVSYQGKFVDGSVRRELENINVIPT